MLEIIKSVDNASNVVKSIFKDFFANIPEKPQNIEFSVKVKTIAGHIFKKSVKVFSNGSIHSRN